MYIRAYFSYHKFKAVVLKKGVATHLYVTSYVEVCRQTIQCFHFVEKDT